jgi:hypothetical protein
MPAGATNVGITKKVKKIVSLTDIRVQIKADFRYVVLSQWTNPKPIAV